MLNLKGHTVSTVVDAHLRAHVHVLNEHTAQILVVLWLGAWHLAESHITYSWHVHLQTQVDKK